MIAYLYKNNKVKNYRVHRLVAENFIENINDLPCINHKNENRADNYADNLEWCTYSYNNNYGNRKIRFYNTKAKKIRQYKVNGEFVKEWNSIKEASQIIGISKSGIVHCLKGKYKQFKGYVWKYVEEE